ncbi:hypothetical protein LRS74_01005 [Streptomyces sp. LX-29]|uniref:hypothetical protein n=1 Tax=Streptomyces sp. LX-29 TaxID=2900152 RepID=UPI00240D6DA2|nr:hypothetical protein [Streptomyces sp. LX-29]WFB05751.1 hypothetical protein LRS74_01005 [Streptomyces sp. LX-29]
MLTVLDAMPPAPHRDHRHGPRRHRYRGAGPARSDQRGIAMGATFAVRGAGFAAVTVTATGTVGGDAPPGCVGIVAGSNRPP